MPRRFVFYKSFFFIIFIISFSNSFTSDIIFNLFYDAKLPSTILSDSSSVSLVDLQSRIQDISADSISNNNYNFLLGQIMEEDTSDSLKIKILELLPFDYLFPTDYTFNFIPDESDFIIPAINLTTSNNIISKVISIKSDSISIILLGLFSPDLFVKKQFSTALNFFYNFYDEVIEYSKFYAKKNDFIVVVSNLSQYVNSQLSKEATIDLIISFDYIKNRNEKFENGTQFYNIRNRHLWMSKIRFSKKNGKKNHSWTPFPFQFRDEKTD